MTQENKTEQELAHTSFAITSLIKHLNDLIPVTDPMRRLKFASLELKLENAFNDIEKLGLEIVKEEILEKQAQVEQEKPRQEDEEQLSPCCDRKIDEEGFCRGCHEHA